MIEFQRNLTRVTISIVVDTVVWPMGGRSGVLLCWTFSNKCNFITCEYWICFISSNVCKSNVYFTRPTYFNIYLQSYRQYSIVFYCEFFEVLISFSNLLDHQPCMLFSIIVRKWQVINEKIILIFPLFYNMMHKHNYDMVNGLCNKTNKDISIRGYCFNGSLLPMY